MFEYWFIVFSVVFTSIGLLLFKKVAISLETKGGMVKLIKSLFFSRYFILAFFCFMSSVVLYISALIRLDLSLAFSLTGLTYVLVVVGAHFIFKERINKYHMAGVLGIATGLLVFHL